MTRLDALRLLLAQVDPDDAKRTTRVIYPKPDPRTVAIQKPPIWKWWPQQTRTA